jgi:hypothetical protein
MLIVDAGPESPLFVATPVPATTSTSGAAATTVKQTQQVNSQAKQISFMTLYGKH